MKQKTFRLRLLAVMKQGSLTTADLSIWFDRPYHTVRGWLLGYNPWGVHRDRTFKLLENLERTIKSKRKFPVPDRLSPVQRREHITQVRNDLHAGVSKSRPA